MTKLSLSHTHTLIQYKKDGYRQQNVRQRQKLISIIDYDVCIFGVFAAILEIFTVKEWPDLEIWVWGPSRSLKNARFDRPCMTLYQSAIVTIALSCTICELFDVE